MQWSDVMTPPPPRQLRQFAGLFLFVFLGLGAWRWFQGQHDVWAIGLAAAGVVVGLVGLVSPTLVRPIYTGWMVAAFPIGWTVSRLVLAIVFFAVVTPVGWFFRITGRDSLWLRRSDRLSHWRAKRQPATLKEYFRQS